MTLIEAIRERHSVRSFTDAPIEETALARLRAEVEMCNSESGLHIQLVTDEPRAFGESLMARYGKFSGVRNYFAMVGPKGPALEEKVGYYGEKLVILAKTLGLDSCWVGLSYKKIKDAFEIAPGEALILVIALGYAADPGRQHRSKSYEQVCDVEDAPEWFRKGVEAALLAPTALNQQRFTISLVNGKPIFSCPRGPYTRTDLGIVKYHFEIGSYS